MLTVTLATLPGVTLQPLSRQDVAGAGWSDLYRCVRMLLRFPPRPQALNNKTLRNATKLNLPPFFLPIPRCAQRVCHQQPVQRRHRQRAARRRRARHARATRARPQRERQPSGDVAGARETHHVSNKGERGGAGRGDKRVPRALRVATTQTLLDVAAALNGTDLNHGEGTRRAACTQPSARTRRASRRQRSPCANRAAAPPQTASRTLRCACRCARRAARAACC